MFSGAMTAMITPFRDGSLDEHRLAGQIEYQIRAGIDALVPVGTTGESPTLDFDEHQRMIERTVELAAGRIPVIAGTGANATREAIELHTFARKAGANACLSVNPYYNKPTQEGLYRHFMAIADAVDLPMMLYNIPSRTGITMSAATVARLHQANPAIFVAIKEATGDMNMASEIRSLCPIALLSGDDSLTLPLMAIGAAGVVSVLSNLMPVAVKRMVSLAQSGQFAQAAAEHARLFPLIRTLFLDGNPVGIKHAMRVAGLDSGELRLPLCQASEPTRQAIEREMRSAGAPAGV